VARADRAGAHAGGRVTVAPAVTSTARSVVHDLVIGPAEVRSRFDGRWLGGLRMVVAVVSERGCPYRVARRSSKTVLLRTASASELQLGAGQ